MKISIGAKTFDGPWGGGNLFVKNLAEYLRSKGHKVCFDLYSDDLDLILLTDPRKTSSSSAFTHKEIINYKKYINNDVLVVHRINECDERKNTIGQNDFFIEANKCADSTIFVSEWLKSIYESLGLKNDNRVIMTGANKIIFNNENRTIWDKKNKLKIVSHHWSGNWNKGFDIYKRLDQLLNEKKYKDIVEYTYIGNLPNKFAFNNTKHIEPLEGSLLANELKKNHIYLTGSLNEPSGNHHIEAAQCGLPLLFINSGGIPEFCQGFGVQFDNEDFEIKLDEIISKYDFYVKKIESYPFSSNLMSEEYERLFLDLINKDFNNDFHLELEYLIENKNVFMLKRKISKIIDNNYLLSKFILIQKKIVLRLKSLIGKND